jgi:hypothetical protein
MAHSIRNHPISSSNGNLRNWPPFPTTNNTNSSGNNNNLAPLKVSFTFYHTQWIYTPTINPSSSTNNNNKVNSSSTNDVARLSLQYHASALSTLFQPAPALLCNA